ncbi:uncharacterized protein LOC127801850 isoform X3 [Diospyros lotus]|uniref:uncharacterized protein LOC127801850 isoform X2 n=1 Tax=Diospyros lotus TaxID=55363 RepID=UPI002257810E|nr:uncharacterized protein LOC127801850 isoform X2 [Diospyros lotus]XP_052193304.1 uncharacterized protein LOC127801850 isoform X3 [Diospyros lotus]
MKLPPPSEPSRPLHSVFVKGGEVKDAEGEPVIIGVVRLTGAGDCLVGATLACISAGLVVIQSLAVGIAAAKAAVEAETNVPADYSLAKVAGMEFICSLQAHMNISSNNFFNKSGMKQRGF